MQLSVQIRTYWGVDDALKVIAKYGAERVRQVHEKLVELARMQRLSHVSNLSGYFIRAVERFVSPDRSQWQPTADRSDEFIERYIAKQRARGAKAR